MPAWCCGMNVIHIGERLTQLKYYFAGLHPCVVDLGQGTRVRCWLPSRLRHVLKHEESRPLVANGDHATSAGASSANSTSAEAMSSPSTGAGRPKVRPRMPMLLLHGFGASGIWQWQKQVRQKGGRDGVHLCPAWWGAAGRMGAHARAVPCAECCHHRKVVLDPGHCSAGETQQWCPSSRVSSCSHVTSCDTVTTSYTLSALSLATSQCHTSSSLLRPLPLCFPSVSPPPDPFLLLPLRRRDARFGLLRRLLVLLPAQIRGVPG